jgi:hypothetical protein
MTDRAFSSYTHSAFLSYAHDDDQAWAGWITNFNTELNRMLPPRLHGIVVPSAHLSSKNGPIAGPLNEELRKNVAASFAMILFVHDNYLTSEWCLHELEYFKELFGDDGFRERFFVIAMSEHAIKELTSRPQWKLVCPFDDQVWMPFFDDDDHNIPMEIYASNTRDKQVIVANGFWRKFLRVREALANKIRATVDREQHAPAYPDVAPAPARSAASPEDEPLVRVYIEGNKDQETYWESLGAQVVASWNEVVAPMRIEPQLYLRPTGLQMTEIDQRPVLDDADGVVLLWGKKTPDSLAAQINKVEPKLSGPSYAPGLIAYLMEGPNDTRSAGSVLNWPVVRFAAAPAGGIAVLDEDAAALKAFLISVLDRKRKRLSGGNAANGALAAAPAVAATP